MPSTATDTVSLLLTPSGHLLLAPDVDAPGLSAALQQGLADAFALGVGHGLLHLGATQVGTVLLCRGAMRSAKQAAPGA